MTHSLGSSPTSPPLVSHDAAYFCGRLLRRAIRVCQIGTKPNVRICCLPRTSKGQRLRKTAGVRTEDDGFNKPIPLQDCWSVWKTRVGCETFVGFGIQENATYVELTSARHQASHFTLWHAQGYACLTFCAPDACREMPRGPAGTSREFCSFKSLGRGRGPRGALK